MMDLDSLTSTGAWRLEPAGDGIAFLDFDLPHEKVNKLTEAVLEDLDRILAELAREEALRALIVIGGKEGSDTFIAGADIHEIRAVTDTAEARRKASQGQAVLHRFSTMPLVTVAAIHGNCLGGGTELALACDLRIATHSRCTQIGLPEVRLGILPGFGGTQRLPRRVGLMQALPVILKGEPLEVRRAYRIGLVDRVVYPPLLRASAVRLAKEALERGGKSYAPRRRRRASVVLRVLETLRPFRELVRWRVRKDLLKRLGSHYEAPFRALEAAVDGYGMTLEKGLELEARLVAELVTSPIAKNLIELFLTSEAARRGRGGERPSLEDGASIPPGSWIGLVGAGVMGGGLAALIARKGYRVRMKDVRREAVEAALRRVHSLYDARVRRGRMTRAQAANAAAAISSTLDSSGFERLPLILEAVVEDIGVKQAVFRDLEKAGGPNAVIATNTSALSVTAIQSVLESPERAAGLHFFNPVERMLLVEVIRGEHTSDDTLARVEDFARRLGKVPVRCADGPGFLVNRLLAPYLNEAVRLFEEGYDPTGIDAAMRRFGMPMGPFELLDEVGLDVAAKVSRILHQAFAERARPPALLESLTSRADVLGKKTGRGFYLHRGRRKRPNPEVLRLGGTGGKNYKPEDAELWVKRLIYPIINEAARALDEKVVRQPSDVDLAMVLGTGFAPFRGGPLRYADTLGVGQVAGALRSLREPRLLPSEPLEELARSGEGFYSAEKKSTGVLSG